MTPSRPFAFAVGVLQYMRGDDAMRITRNVREYTAGERRAADSRPYE